MVLSIQTAWPVTSSRSRLELQTFVLGSPSEFNSTRITASKIHGPGFIQPVLFLGDPLLNWKMGQESPLELHGGCSNCTDYFRITQPFLCGTLLQKLDCATADQRTSTLPAARFVLLHADGKPDQNHGIDHDPIQDRPHGGCLGPSANQFTNSTSTFSDDLKSDHCFPHGLRSFTLSGSFAWNSLF